MRHTPSFQRAMVCCLMVAVRAAGAQSPLLDSLVRANSRALEMHGGTLSGPGADFLLSEAAGAQFLAIGEEHNAEQVPVLVTALLRALQGRAGYQYLAEEQDPLSARRVSRAPVRGNVDSVVAMARRYLHAFTFMSDQELAMLADVGRISTGRADPIWGCDQAFGATHYLDALLATSLAPDAHSYVVALRDSAQVKERVRNLAVYSYMADEPKTEAFERLGGLVDPSPRSDAGFLVHSLIISDRVYRNYRDSLFYENGREREEYMKARFLEGYRLAERADHRPPRVILKFGHWHLFRGLGPSNLQTLGDFVSQFAIANGSWSFNVAIFPNDAPGGYGDLRAWSDTAPYWLSRGGGPGTWAILDLRALRGYYRRLGPSMSPEQRDLFRRWVFGFDAALFIGDMKRATYELNPGVEY